MPQAPEYYFILLVVAIKVRDKLAADTRRSNTPVRVLVLQANLLDRLTSKLALLQKIILVRRARGLPPPPPPGEVARLQLILPGISDCYDALVDECYHL